MMPSTPVAGHFFGTRRHARPLSLPQGLTSWLTWTARYASWPMAAAFFLAVLPLASHFFTHHPDERHFRDAALGMLRSGDYLTPRVNDEPLFHALRKPIITYWLVAAGYLACDTSPLGARLPFLLAACLTIWLTHRIGLLLTGCHATARLAALAAAVHPALLVCGVRSTPDMPFTMIVLASAYGFLNLIVNDRASPRWLLVAYGAGGLAVATRGLPGVVFVGVAMAFIGLHPRLKGAKQWLAHTPWLALGCLIAGAWFVAMHCLHGEEIVAGMHEDQIVARLRRLSWLRCLQLPQYLLLLGASFLPWLLPLWRRSRWPLLLQSGQPAHRRHGFQFIAVWCAIYLVLASCVDRVNLRYLTVIVPLIAVPLAAAVKALPMPVLQWWWRRMLAVSLAAVIAVAAAALVSGVAFNQPTLGAVALLCAAAFASIAWRAAATCRWARMVHLAAAAQLALYPLAFAVAAPLALPDIGQHITQELRRYNLGDEPILIVGAPSVHSRVQLFAFGVATTTNRQELNGAEHRRYPVVVIVNRDTKLIEAGKYELHRYAYGLNGGLNTLSMYQALRQGQWHEYLRQHQNQVTIAVRRNAAATALAGVTASAATQRPQ